LQVVLICLQCFDAVGWQQEGHPTCKKTEWWDAGVVMCLGQGADLHTTQLMPLPLTMSDWFYFLGFTFLVSAHPSGPGQNPRGL